MFTHMQTLAPMCEHTCVRERERARERERETHTITRTLTFVRTYAGTANMATEASSCTESCRRQASLEERGIRK